MFGFDLFSLEKSLQILVQLQHVKQNVVITIKGSFATQAHLHLKNASHLGYKEKNLSTSEKCSKIDVAATADAISSSSTHVQRNTSRVFYAKKSNKKHAQSTENRTRH